MTIIPSSGILQDMKLLEYLKKEDMTFEEFADKIGKNPQAIHKYAHFHNYPRQDTAQKIVAATKGKVSLADIYANAETK